MPNQTLTPEFVKAKFDAAHPYDDYVATGTPDHQHGWNAFAGSVTLTAPQTELLQSFTREVNALFLSGTWCGDCVQQLPIVGKIAAANPGKIRPRFLDRDEHMDLAEHLKVCGGNRVPVGLLLNEDFDVLAMVGDRTLSRYRAIAARNLGASCALPGAPVPEDEVAATTQDWVNEFERAHLICRLSTKLRQRHGD